MSTIAAPSPNRPTHAFHVNSRDVLAIALPASVAFITEPLAGLVDVVVIGRLGDAALLGGLVLGALLFDVIFSLAYFLRIGTAGLVAQAVGSRDTDEGLIHAARALVLAVLIGVLMIALAIPLLWLSELALAPPPEVRAALATYFFVGIWAAPFSLVNYALLGWFYGRAAAKTGMVLQLLTHGVNIVSSIVLVFGLGWGVAGAALGTVLGSAAAALLGLFLLQRHFGGIGAILARIDRPALLDAVGLRRMFGLSRDLMIRSMALMAAYAWFAAQGSRAGEVTLAANAILLNLLMIGGFFMDGIAQAAEQLCGKAVGANWRPAFEQAYRLSFQWGLALAVFLCAIWYFGGGPLIGFMTSNTEVQQFALAHLGLAALCAITFMPAFVYDGILVGATMNVVMRNGMVASLAVFLAAALVLQPLWGNYGLWAALHIWFLARGAIYWWALRGRRAALFT